MKITYNSITKLFSVSNPDKVFRNVLNGVISGGFEDMITNIPSMYIEDTDESPLLESTGYEIYSRGNYIPFPCEFTKLNEPELAKYLDPDDMDLIRSIVEILRGYPNVLTRYGSGKPLFDLRVFLKSNPEFKDSINKYPYKSASVKNGVYTLNLKDGGTYYLVPIDIVLKDLRSKLKVPELTKLDKVDLSDLIFNIRMK